MTPVTKIGNLGAGSASQKFADPSRILREAGPLIARAPVPDQGRLYETICRLRGQLEWEGNVGAWRSVCRMKTVEQLDGLWETLEILADAGLTAAIRQGLEEAEAGELLSDEEVWGSSSPAKPARG